MKPVSVGQGLGVFDRLHLAFAPVFPEVSGGRKWLGWLLTGNDHNRRWNGTETVGGVLDFQRAGEDQGWLAFGRT